MIGVMSAKGRVKGIKMSTEVTMFISFIVAFIVVCVIRFINR